jgi:hypothetical protein
LVHVEIDKFLDDLWVFPLVDSDRWDQWENAHPTLVHVGLGDLWPDEFEKWLTTHHVDPQHFRRLLGNVVEVVFSSFYGAADDKLSLEYLLEVLAIVAEVGVNPPPLAKFGCSLFVDGHGWGRRLSAEERDGWREIGT